MHVELCFKLQYGVFTENDKFVCTNNVKMQVDREAIEDQLVFVSGGVFVGKGIFFPLQSHCCPQDLMHLVLSCCRRRLQRNSKRSTSKT